MPTKNVKGLTASHLKFIEWLSVPKGQRVPRTQAEFAAELGIEEATLSRWKRIPGLMDEVNAIARQIVKDNLADVYSALLAKASDGDVPAIKLILEVTREYVPRQELTGKDGDAIRIDVSQMSDDELRAIAES